jgi:hypothetical protein
MTHDELVERAVRWLRSNQRCAVVLAETGHWFVGEFPDAIGWTARGASILIECKSTMSDYRNDARKWFRKGNLGMGASRYYLTPPGLLKAEEVELNWGLLEARPHMIKVVRRPVEGTPNREAETTLLVAELRRLANGHRKPDDRVGSLVALDASTGD